MSLTQDEKREAWVAFVDAEGNRAEAARSLGLAPRTLGYRLDRYMADRGITPGEAKVMARTGSGENRPTRWWVSDNGQKFSAQFDRPDSLITLDQIREAVSTVPPVGPVINPPFNPTPPDHISFDLIPIPDLHSGLLCDPEITGSDYNTKIAGTRVFSWASTLMHNAEKGRPRTLVIGVIGDITHADDQENVTRKSKNPLDVDSRYGETFIRTVRSLVQVVDLAACLYDSVVIYILHGNHDPNTAHAIRASLIMRYSETEGVSVVENTRGTQCFVKDRNMIVLSHGHEVGFKNGLAYVSNLYPEEWGKTRHRFLHLGHIHQAKKGDPSPSAISTAGALQIEYHPPVASPDAYSIDNFGGARSGMTLIRYSKQFGEHSRYSLRV